MQLRGYQQDLENEVVDVWAQGLRNALAVLPTGGGKTATFSSIVNQWAPRFAPWLKAAPGACAVAHRRELVSQMSLTLARYGVRHRVIGSTTLHKACTRLHIEEVGRAYVDPNSANAVAGIDTLIGLDPRDPFFNGVGLWIMDEAHHVLRENKWGKGCALFPNAWGLGVTATPTRANGRGLGRHAHGVFDRLVQGPTMRDLIRMGYLTDYRVFCPRSNIDLSNVKVGDSGEFVDVQLRAARKRSSLTGDLVEAYLQHAAGKLGITFDVDIESATETAAAYRARGVPAEVVSSKTPEDLRAMILRRFKAREVLQLVNVDLFGEGFDLPAVEVVSMGRPTASYSLFAQQFGRMVRLMVLGFSHAQWEAMTPALRLAAIAASPKPKGILIDHVGNVARHGLPDRWREWTLDARESRARSTPTDAVPTWDCPECGSANERVHKVCQYPPCTGELLPPGRSTLEQVDGDLVELDPSVLASLRGEVARIDGPPPRLSDAYAMAGAAKHHRARQIAQESLRSWVAQWAGCWRVEGHGDSEIWRRFFHTYRLDVMTAQTLGAKEAEALRDRVAADTQRLLEQIGRNR